MLKELQESYVAKYESPLAARAHYAILDGMGDESTGDVAYGAATDRIGKRLVWEDSQGFVGCTRYPTVEAAKAVFASIEADYNEWLGE